MTIFKIFVILFIAYTIKVYRFYNSRVRESISYLKSLFQSVAITVVKAKMLVYPYFLSGFIKTIRSIVYAQISYQFLRRMMINGKYFCSQWDLRVFNIHPQITFH